MPPRPYVYGCGASRGSKLYEHRVSHSIPRSGREAVLGTEMDFSMA